MAFRERINELISWLKISRAEFERRAGLSNGYTRNLGGVPGAEKLESILRAFPAVSRVWLLTGEGEMFKSEQEGRDENLTGEYDVLERDSIDVVPLLPVSAMANSLAEYIGPGIRRIDCQSIVSPVPGAEFAIVISGDSMEPKFRDGMIVFLKRINEAAFIPWGNSLVIDTVNGAFIKDVFPVPGNDDYIEARSANPLYPPMLIPKDSINGMFRILSATKFYTTM